MSPCYTTLRVDYLLSALYSRVWSGSPLPYDSQRRQVQRRWIQNAYGDKIAVQRFEGMQQREACILLSGLIERPGDFVLHLKRRVTYFI